MTVLLLRLAGPLQSWGVRSRFSERTTEPAPSRSGIIGLLAAAQGRRRTDPIEDLLTLRFGVRLDQPGRMTRDFQTARTLDGRESMPISYRYYIEDAVFLAGIEGDATLVEGLEEALSHPAYPLYLGRRSCPPTLPIVLGKREGNLHEALRSEPWQASKIYQERCARYGHTPLDLELHIDALALAQEDRGHDSWVVRDVPASFSMTSRTYGFRQVERRMVPNPAVASMRAVPTVSDPLDPFGPLEMGLESPDEGPEPHEALSGTMEGES